MKWLPVPTIEVGEGVLARLPAFLSAHQVTRLIIVSGSGPSHRNLIDQLLLQIPSDVQVSLYDHVYPDPSLEASDEAIEFARDFKAEGVIGIGGGSTLDTAKLVAALAGGTGAVSSVIGTDLVQGRTLPLVAIPTTAGTGSEVTPIAIVSDHDDDLKKAVVSDRLIPQLALLDPVLTVSLPPAQTAYTGIDALTHAIESYLSLNATPMSELLSLEAIRLISGSLRTAHRDGQDLKAREAMLLGSLTAGIAFANAGVAAVHAFAYPLGGRFNLPHGLAVGLMLVSILRFNAPAPGIKEKYEKIAQAMGLDPSAGPSAFIDACIQLLEDLEFPTSLQAVGVPETALEEMAKKVVTIDRLLKNNPRGVTPEAALTLYQRAYRGHSAGGD